MIFYLSDRNKLQTALDVTGLALDELELVVGRFSKRSTRAGELRGQIFVKFDRVEIRHHFSKKLLWSNL